MNVWSLHSDNSTRDRNIKRVTINHATVIDKDVSEQEFHLINLGVNQEDHIVAYSKVAKVSDMADNEITIASYAAMGTFLELFRELQAYGKQRGLTPDPATYTPAASPVVELALPVVPYAGLRVDLATLAGDLTIQGIKKPSQSEQKSFYLHNTSTTHSIILSDDDANQTDPTERIQVASSNDTIAPQAVALLRYDETLERWYLSGGSMA